MTTVAGGQTTQGATPGLARGLWQRQLGRYPDTAARYAFLGIVVVATIVLYYELYVSGAVAPSILRQFDMSFGYYVLILVFGNALGAFASLFAGLADRWGRANLVAYGLLATGALTLWGVPNATSGFEFGVFFALVSIVEGMVLVATPALVRDFSPQIGRAAAMGFWTLGPVVGSLLVTEISSHTLSRLPAWQDQFRICGIVGLVVWAIAFVGLRELSPQLRDQLMVSLRDRLLVEARARSIDPDQLLHNHWRQMLRPDIVLGALAVSLFLIIYYTAVAFAVIYLTTVFGFSQDTANGLLNWWWGVEAVSLVAIGLASDVLLVRKPFMLAGALGTIAMSIVLIDRTGHPDTSYNTLVVVVSVLAFFLSLAYAPWMAAFTETVEKVNPAATATGLAVWGWIIRAVVSISFLAIPHVVPSVTPLVDYGPQVQAIAAQVGPELRIVQAHPALFAELAKYNPAQIPPSLLARAVQELGGPEKAIPQLEAVAKVAPQLRFLLARGPEVLAARQSAPSEWQHWLWICVGGQVAFLPLMLLLTGPWSPRRARQDVEEHERQLQRELAALGISPARSGP